MISLRDNRADVLTFLFPSLMYTNHLFTLLRYGLLTIKKGNKHMIILNGIEALIQLAMIASHISCRRALLKRTLILIVIVAVIFTCFFTIFQLALGERSKQIFFACASVIFYCIMQILPLFSLVSKKNLIN